MVTHSWPSQKPQVNELSLKMVRIFPATNIKMRCNSRWACYCCFGEHPLLLKKKRFHEKKLFSFFLRGRWVTFFNKTNKISNQPANNVLSKAQRSQFPIITNSCKSCDLWHLYCAHRISHRISKTHCHWKSVEKLETDHRQHPNNTKYW